MKKLLIGLLCIIVAMSLAACGDNSDSSNTEPLTEEEIPSLFTNPESFKGRSVELTGQALGKGEVNGDMVAAQMFCDWENDEDCVVVIIDDTSIDIQDGDFLTVSGIIDGEFEGENYFGASLTMPQISATNVTVATYADIVAPANKTLVPEENTITQHDCTITVDKIELAGTETRVYLTVENNSSDTFYFYEFDCKIVQGGKQYDATDNYDAEYDEIQSDILPGVITSGIVVFDAIGESENFTLITEGYSDDYTLDFNDYKYEVIVE